MRTKKRILVMILCVCAVIGATGVPAASAAPEFYEMPIEPFWQNAATIALNMTFSGGAVNSSGAVTGQVGTTGITAFFTLHRQNANGTFSLVYSWSATNGDTAMILLSSRTTPNQTAGTFRLSVNAGVTRNGWTEIVSESHTMTFH